MIEIEKYARAAASTARTPPNSPARRAALEAENAARVAAEQFVKGLEAERDELRARLAEIEAQEPVAISKAGNLFWAGNPQDWRGVDCGLFTRPVPAQAVPDGAIPTVVDALEFRRDQYGLQQQQWALVLGMQPSHYSEFVAGKRRLPRGAMSQAFAHGVPAVALFQHLPDLGATDIDRRLAQMSAAAPEHKA